jgi:hypothetical protein
MSNRDPFLDVLSWQIAWDRRAIAHRGRQCGLQFKQIAEVLGLSTSRTQQLVKTHNRRNAAASPLEDYLAADPARTAITDFLNIGSLRVIRDWRNDELARADSSAEKIARMTDERAIARRLHRALDVVVAKCAA